MAKHHEVGAFYLTIGRETVLPYRFYILRLFGLKVLRSEEKFGPYLRLVEVSKLEPGSIIITLDDDSLYPPESIASLLATHREIPSGIVGMRGCRVPRGRMRNFKYGDLVEILDDQLHEGPDIFLTCSGGSLYPPATRVGLLVDWSQALELSPRNDDIWYFFAARTEGIPMIIAAGKERNPKNIKGSQEQALWRENVIQGRNDVFLSQCHSHFSKVSSSRRAE